MKPEEALGAILSGLRDPERAAKAIAAALLSEPSQQHRILREIGLDQRLVLAAVGEVPDDPGAIGLIVNGALAWARGRHAALPKDEWEVVATLAPGVVAPARLRRETAETLVTLVAKAKRCVRLAAPFSDPWVASVLCEPLAYATKRGVLVEVFLAGTDQPGPQADTARVFEQGIAASGRSELFRIVRPDPGGPWPHLKLVTVDGSLAYVGSANLTAAGLRSNLEVGVLLSGTNVTVLDSLLDLIAKSPEGGG